MKLSHKLQGFVWMILLILIAFVGYKYYDSWAYQTMVGEDEYVGGELEIEGLLKLHKQTEEPETDPDHYILYMDNSDRLTVKFPGGTTKGVNWHTE